MNFNVIWLRHDLRLNDNPGFSLAKQAGLPLRVVFIMPPFWLNVDEETPFTSTVRPECKADTGRIGLAKARFLRACLIDLQRQLALQNIDFKMVYQQPAELFRDWKKQGMQQVFTQHAQAPEESHWLEQLEQQNIALTLYNNQTLFEGQQIGHLFERWPTSFSAFRRKIEKQSITPDAPKPPVTISHLSDHFDGRIPSIPWHNDFNTTANSANQDPGQSFNLIGGENAGLAHLSSYLWQARGLLHYKDSRNQLCGLNFSSQLSAHLAWGALSVRNVWHETERWEQQHGENEHSQWFKQELLWREYFHWSMRIYGRKFFRYQGLKQEPLTPPPFNASHWQQWVKAETGVPLIDAGIKELITTGYSSNRMRQNLASYFIQYLKLDWRLGAAFFERHLLDYDVASNWGNWAYLAGVGQDPRSSPGKGRIFNINFQLQNYDPELTHIKLWLPKLAQYSLKDIQQHSRGDKLLPDYPAPIATEKDAATGLV